MSNIQWPMSDVQGRKGRKKGRKMNVQYRMSNVQCPMAKEEGSDIARFHFIIGHSLLDIGHSFFSFAIRHSSPHSLTGSLTVKVAPGPGSLLAAVMTPP